MWEYIRSHVLELITFISVASIFGVVYEIKDVQNEIKKTLEIMLKDPKNIVIEDMKVSGTFGFDEKENKRIEKMIKWKIIGIISIFINAIFILLMILGTILEQNVK